MKRLFSAILSATAVTAFGTSPADPADLVYRNASIYTVNDRRVWAEAMAVKDGKIVFIGSDNDVMPFIGDSTEVLDAEGDFISPGFIDSHSHPLLGTLLMGAIPIPEGDLDAIKQSIQDHVAEHPDSPSYVGMGWGIPAFGDEGPTAAVLDELIPDKPAFMIDSGGHAAWFNTPLLKLLGLDTAEVVDPYPGLYYYIRDDEGKPNGFLKGSYTYFPAFSALDMVDETFGERFKELQKIYSEQGITGVYDAGTGEALEPIVYSVANKMAEDDTLDFRLYASHWIQVPDQTKKAIEVMDDLHGKFGSNPDRFDVSTIKVHNDGILEIHTAGMLENYTDLDSTGTPMLTQETLNQLAMDAAKNDYMVHVHAIGDQTVRDSLDAFEKVREAGYTDPRMTVAHVQVTSEEDLPRFGESNVVAQTSPMWLGHGSEETLERIGEERFDNMFRVKDIIEGGGVLAFGADWPASGAPIALQAPLLGMQTAVMRQHPDSEQVQPPLDQKLSLEEAYKAYTLGSAYMVGKDDKIGSLEVGKYADFVRLSGNPFEVADEEVMNIGVKETWMNGKKRFEGDGTPIYADIIAEIKDMAPHLEASHEGADYHLEMPKT